MVINKYINIAYAIDSFVRDCPMHCDAYLTFGSAQTWQELKLEDGAGVSERLSEWVDPTLMQRFNLSLLTCAQH